MADGVVLIPVVNFRIGSVHRIQPRASLAVAFFAGYENWRVKNSTAEIVDDMSRPGTGGKSEIFDSPTFIETDGTVATTCVAFLPR